MRLDEFTFELPEGRIAQEPAERRDASRLMILDRVDGLRATTFDRIGATLRAGDLLVVNDTRVRPARLLARKPSGGRVELLLLRRDGEAGGDDLWRAMISTGRGLRPGSRLAIAPGFEAELAGEADEGCVRLRLRVEQGDAEAALARHGTVPLPPYIRRDPDDPRRALDRERYQTVYARQTGAVAAPTAGLHFTEELLDALGRLGIERAALTLHVGPGTFRPIRSERIEDHRLDPEAFELPEATRQAIAACRARGGRVVAVGTTVARVLEDRALPDGTVRPGSGWCGLYIMPGHRFRVVDALLTNFHLPRSSLLVLVAAFAGRERILAAYREALALDFRFYSYGDAMLIL
jgi:S-adenosylmethionine:tRNA ribosyltransferase-isomerase